MDRQFPAPFRTSYLIRTHYDLFDIIKKKDHSHLMETVQRCHPLIYFAFSKSSSSSASDMDPVWLYTISPLLFRMTVWGSMDGDAPHRL